MPKVKINRERCKGCQLCLIYCPKGLIEKDKNLNKKGIQPLVFRNGECNGCKFCAIICPDGAVEIYK
ncbi:MAG TPA: 4Fe-4S dicluster domain-containing protein [Candidatus Omnitrophica bacterium]|nr:4Fe-4S dicluster domain-containing protein [Candidatus Omnitrophota bacterium]